MQGAQQARTMQAAETRARDARLSATAPQRDDEGRRVDAQPARPTRAYRRRRARVDQSVMLDSRGGRIEKPGYILKWVRERDPSNRQTGARVADYRNYGFGEVLDPYTNEPIRSHLGLAMWCLPDDYADRILDYTPEGALNPDSLLDATRAAVDSMNRAADGEVAFLTVERDHRPPERTMETVSAGSEDDDPDEDPAAEA